MTTDVIVLLSLALAQGWLLGSLNAYMGENRVQMPDDLVE